MAENSLKEKLNFHCVVKYFLFATNTILWVSDLVDFVFDKRKFYGYEIRYIKCQPKQPNTSTSTVKILRLHTDCQTIVLKKHGIINIFLCAGCLRKQELRNYVDSNQCSRVFLSIIFISLIL